METEPNTDPAFSSLSIHTQNSVLETLRARSLPVCSLNENNYDV